MPWKVGGNFEAVCMMCETNWKECAIAIANYLWSEVVSDVVDYLTRGGIILWVLAIVVTVTILFRMKYRENVHTRNIIVSKQVLSKVGYKIHDLELKVNVLTYKMQYGTWPLPHQIYNVNPKKLQKIRMTLSNPGDRKNWIKNVLLSPVKSDVFVPYTNIFNPFAAKLTTDFSDVIEKRIPHRVPCDKSTECSSIETSKTTSDQSVNACSRRPGLSSQNVSAKGIKLSRSENFAPQRRNVQFLPMDPDEINRRSSKALLTAQYSKCSTNTNPCQKFTDTVRKCKSFLKELEIEECNDKSFHSRNCSLGRSEASSSNDVHAMKQPASLVIAEKKVSRETHESTKKDEINEEMRYVQGIEDNNTTMVDLNEADRRSNADISADVVTKSNVDATISKQLVPMALPMIRSTQSSRETLYEVRKRLQSLHNVLRSYEELSRSAERQVSLNPVGEIVETFVSYGPKIEEIDENKTVANRDADSRDNLRQIQCATMDNRREHDEPDRSEESSSSSAGCSSSTSNKTYRCSSEIATKNSRPEGYELRGRPAWTSDQVPFLAESNDYRQHPSFYCATLHAPKYYENRRDRSAYVRNVSDRGHELEPSPKRVDENVAKTSVSFNLAEKKSEAKELRHILSPESFEDKSVSSQNGSSPRRNVAVEKFSNVFNGEQCRENVIIISRRSSRSKVSKNNSDTEEKSTALLLKEALHMKRTLLSRIESERRCLACDDEYNVLREESPLGPEAQNESNNFPSMVLDIKAEEPITDTCRGKINQHYVHLEMKQRRDLLPRSLRNINASAHSNSEGEAANEKSLVAEIPSEYFSVSDLTVHENEPSKPPIYDKVISITIPVDVEDQDAIDPKEKSTRAKIVVENTRMRANSRQNLSENASADDLDVAKRSSTVLKLEDLILERMRDIRNCMDAFLQSQNRAISETRRALRCQYENEPSHVILHNNRLIASSSRDDRIANSSSNSQRPKLLINTVLPDYKREIIIEDGILKCRSDLSLKRNPGLFTLVAPTKNIASGKNDAPQRSEIATEVARGETDLSLKVILPRSCENDSATKREAGNLKAISRGEYVTSNTKHDVINEGVTANVNFQKREEQTRDSESTFSAVSCLSLDVPRDDVNVTTQTTRDKCETRSRYNSISRNSLYLTDETTVKIDNVSSEHSHFAKSHLRLKETKQDIVKRQISVDKHCDANTASLPNETANLEHCNLIGLNFNSNKSEHDYSTNARATLKESDEVIYDTGALDIKEETDDDSLLNNTRENKSDEIYASNVHLSPRMKRQSTNRLCRTYSRIKAKSDISLIATATKDSNIDLCAKRSHSFVCHDTSEHVPSVLHQPSAKLQNNKNKCNENELRPTTPSKSTRSCIPILKNRLDAARRMKRQTHTRSPTRSPLTMLWRERTCKKNSRTDEEVICETSIPIDKHLCAEETALNLAKLNAEESAFAKGAEKTEKHIDSNVKAKDNLEMQNDRNVESLEIDKNSDRFIRDSIKDTKIIESIENTALKAVTIISILANDNLLKNYSTNSTGVSIGKTEKEVTAKPSITDTCTSMSDLC